MATIQENRQTWDDYDWSQQGDEWSQTWGGTPRLFWGTIYPRILDLVPAATILEIAPGYGRVTQYLKDFCERLIVVDLTPRCIEACRERFRGVDHISYHVNDGKSLDMVDDGAVDFVFSFDSLVHAEKDVLQAYVSELARKLAPDGVGFLHHSNVGAYLDPLTGELSIENRHWRGQSMSAELFRRYCVDAGLECIGQEIVNWGQPELNDCFSMLARPGSAKSRPPQIRENSTFMDEANALGEVARQYGF